MKVDPLLFLIIFFVWMGIAGVYALVPLFHMPGYAEVWGLGSLIFLILALLIWASGRRRPDTTGLDAENKCRSNAAPRQRDRTGSPS